jgi:TPR repeat protein
MLAVAILIAMAAGVVAGPLEDARAAYQRGEYTTTLGLLRPLADQGIAMAQFNLGLMYNLGQGVQQNYAEALKWFRKAADQGNANAQYGLATMYGLGQGTPQNYMQALMWYNLAASNFPANEKERRDKAIKGRDLVSAKMTPAQIAGGEYHQPQGRMAQSDSQWNNYEGR